MKLVLINNEGEVLKDWDIKNEFGDIEKALPRALMVSQILGTYKKFKDSGTPTSYEIQMLCKNAETWIFWYECKTRAEAEANLEKSKGINPDRIFRIQPVS